MELLFDVEVVGFGEAVAFGVVVAFGEGVVFDVVIPVVPVVPTGVGAVPGTRTPSVGTPAPIEVTARTRISRAVFNRLRV